MTDKERYEQNFRDVFSKLNKSLPMSAFTATMIVLVGLWGSMFSLIYVDIQNHKDIDAEQRVEVIRALGEVKVMIEKIKK